MTENGQYSGGEKLFRWISVYLRRGSDGIAASNTVLGSDLGFSYHIFKATGGFSLYFASLCFSTQDTLTVSTTASLFNTKNVPVFWKKTNSSILATFS